MKKILNRLIIVCVNPLGAYIVSFIGLFIYFLFCNDSLNQSLTSALFFAFFVAFAVVFVGSLVEEIISLAE